MNFLNNISFNISSLIAITFEISFKIKLDPNLSLNKF